MGGKWKIFEDHKKILDRLEQTVSRNMYFKDTTSELEGRAGKA